MGAGKGGGTGQSDSQGQSGGGASSGTGMKQAQGQNIQYGIGASAGYYGDRGGGAAGDSSGGQSQGQGGAGQAGAGSGEEGALAYRYEIYDAGGFVSQSGFDYSTLEDARDAGLAKAVYPEYVMVVANKVGFTGPNSRYDTQPPLEEGVVVTEGPGGTTYTGQGDKPAKKPGGASGDDSSTLPGLDSNWLMYLIIGIMILALIGLGLRGRA
jgi:hypothetical protein